MSYPKNKRERFLVGKRKGYKRVSLWFRGNDTENRELRERHARHHRNTTRICSAIRCCGNPRRRGELTFQELRFLDSLKD